ncbi:hypothetical protein PG985_009923 [Apiospora marii]|uniref:uncharacterized protein n=1 Tax=Apiospora marii TaxID=335849 RepID=UPI003131E739
MLKIRLDPTSAGLSTQFLNHLPRLLHSTVSLAPIRDRETDEKDPDRLIVLSIHGVLQRDYLGVPRLVGPAVVMRQESLHNGGVPTSRGIFDRLAFHAVASLQKPEQGVGLSSLHRLLDQRWLVVGMGGLPKGRAWDVLFHDVFHDRQGAPARHRGQVLSQNIQIVHMYIWDVL